MHDVVPPIPPGYAAAAPIIETIRVGNCPVCGGTSPVPYAQGFDYESQTCRNHWTFWQCGACEAVWIDPRPALSELGTIYPPTYYAYEMSETLSPFVLKGKAFLDRLKFKGILKRLSNNPKSFLDVGCGDGRYLFQFAASGMPRPCIYGIDLPSAAMPKLRAAGFQIYAGRVEDCETIEPGSIDLITMFHVIEHVKDPVNVLRKLARWLTPGGVLALETPNTSSIDCKLFSSGWWGGSTSRAIGRSSIRKASRARWSVRVSNRYEFSIKQAIRSGSMRFITVSGTMPRCHCRGWRSGSIR